ncbi:hypothetical protein EHQ43_01405 [Leptospira bouyouniensis]|uniref:Uncharacterized protein n=1 Tax=Leptospira bouyouniensis TaxID=2484911 RepID=A0A7I0HXA0_9LEPT|nr:hypothetical protein EHQ43_01405 [Leptospira bouyouniensis]
MLNIYKGNLFPLFLLSLSILQCSSPAYKENEVEVLNSSDYGYLRFNHNLNEGVVVIETKIFKDLTKCHGDYNCSGEDHFKHYSNLQPTNPSFAVTLIIGEYFAISKLRYSEMSFFNCRKSEVTIYHGFRFKEVYDPNHPSDLYSKDTCEYIDRNKVVCPPVQISKKGIHEITITKVEERGRSLSMVHLLDANIVFSTFNFLFCGPVSSEIDFLELQARKMGQKEF